MNNKVKITLFSVGALVVIGGATVGIASLANNGTVENKASSGSETSKTSSQASSVVDKPKGTVTVKDVSEKPKLAATVVSLYGADKLDDTGWSKVGKSVQDKSQDVDLFFSTSQDGGKYKFILEEQAPNDKGPWYRLVADGADVVYFDINDGKLQNVPFQKVVDYVNNNYSDAELEEMRDRMFIQEEGQPRDRSQRTNGTTISNNTKTKTTNQGKSVDIKKHAETDKMLWTREILTYINKSDDKTAEFLPPDELPDPSETLSEGELYIGQFKVEIMEDKPGFIMSLWRTGRPTVYEQQGDVVSMTFMNGDPTPPVTTVSTQKIESFLDEYDGELVELSVV